VAVSGVWFIFNSLAKSSKPPAVAKAPELPKVPERVYGIIEPAGREVYLTSASNRPVRKISVNEGDRVKKGQLMVELENEVELAQIQVAESGVELRRKELEISRYDLEKKKSLQEKGGAVAQYDIDQLRLKMEFDSLNLASAEKELALAREQLRQLELRSPIDGIIYKLEVKLGESLGTGETKRIILGSPDLWVRLYVETFWMDRFQIGDRFKVLDSETSREIGTGAVVSKTLFLSDRNFRVDAAGERFDAEFRQIILKLEPSRADIPLGMNVIATPENTGGRSPKGHPNGSLRGIE
jgi:multidrug efflux pump subunit AcrA (membrane-fusion protein)